MQNAALTHTRAIWCAFVAIVLLALSCFAAPASGQDIRAAGAAWPPWIMRAGSEQAGIAIDVLLEAARRSGLTASFDIMPRKRVELLFQAGELNAEPAIHKPWRSFDPNSDFTEPFALTRNVLMARAGQYAPVNNPRELPHLTIGTNRGFHYTDGFETLFAQDRLERDDWDSSKSLVNKLVSGRVDACIIDLQEFAYWTQRQSLSMNDFQTIYNFQEPSRLRIRIHKDASHTIPLLNRALLEMKQDGTIYGILCKYLPSQTAPQSCCPTGKGCDVESP
ncbi:substrate-binding periplasmic protein [Salidesulfovibrio brasiliensis]|uniref:substrate-binding periplasmic protein n=1 Tax=Salidesulfovibrio brasiliensis TaxID=221711 RepID=UPI0006D2BAE5|nr:transporter substrate-binding domain-containing protein [Salidesulfovibrio brasiliensis]